MSDETVGRWMSSEVRGVLATTSVRDAIRVLSDARVGGAPVVDENERIVGVFSLTDAARALAGGGPLADDSFYEPAALVTLIREKANFEPGDVPISGVMSRRVLGVGPDATITDAASRMAEHGVHRLVVLAEDGSLRGVISALDVCRALAAAATPGT